MTHEVMEICRLSGGGSLVCERENLIFDKFIDFLPVERFESRSDMRELGSFNNCTSKRVLDVLKPG